MIKVAVGSKNPIKIESVKKAFGKTLGDCEVVGFSVPSGVSNMPLSFEEVITGAKNRAEKALKEIPADFGVGLEGGFEENSTGTFLVSFVAIKNKDGTWGYAKGAGLLMPQKVVEKVRKEKKELGAVMDEIRGLKNTKQREGCVGFLTNNLVLRQEAFEKTVIYALTRFTKRKMFE